MGVVVRIIGALVGIVLAFPAGVFAGCGIYESGGPDYRQCGYEFEGTGHILIAIATLILVFGFLGQWLAGWLWRRFSNRER